MTRADLVRLTAVAHDRTESLPSSAPAADLYDRAAQHAEHRIPGPLGTAIAGVLAMAAHERRATGIGGCLGAPRVMLALALAVTELPDPASGVG